MSQLPQKPLSRVMAFEDNDDISGGVPALGAFVDEKLRRHALWLDGAPDGERFTPRNWEKEPVGDEIVGFIVSDADLRKADMKDGMFGTIGFRDTDLAGAEFSGTVVQTLVLSETRSGRRPDPIELNDLVVEEEAMVGAASGAALDLRLGHARLQAIAVNATLLEGADETRHRANGRVDITSAAPEARQPGLEGGVDASRSRLGAPLPGFAAGFIGTMAIGGGENSVRLQGPVNRVEIDGGRTDLMLRGQPDGWRPAAAEVRVDEGGRLDLAIRHASVRVLHVNGGAVTSVKGRDGDIRSLRGASGELGPVSGVHVTATTLGAGVQRPAAPAAPAATTRKTRRDAEDATLA